jgi:gas vesicle protein
MEKEKNNNNGKLIAAVLVGATVGAALGILFAPNKGSETRKKLLAKGEDLTEGLKGKLNEYYDRAKTDTDHVKSKVLHENSKA